MKSFTGCVSTNKVGSECEFEFEVEDDATEEEIEAAAREAMFDHIEWNFEPATEVTE
jgi:hypothetical protein